MNVSALLYGSGDSSSSNHSSVSSGRTAWISASVIKQSRAASVTSDGNFSLTDGGSGSAAAAASTIPSSWLNLTSSYVDNSTDDRTSLPFYSNESDSFWSPRNTSTSGGLWNSSSGGGGSTSATPTGLSPMAIHFLAVGSLFIAVLILAVANVYLHIRQQRRARLFAAPSPPPERHCSTRRRRSGRGSGGAAAAAAGEAEAAATERRIRMTVRMKPSKMFVV